MGSRCLSGCYEKTGSICWFLQVSHVSCITEKDHVPGSHENFHLVLLPHVSASFVLKRMRFGGRGLLVSGEDVELCGLLGRAPSLDALVVKVQDRLSIEEGLRGCGLVLTEGLKVCVCRRAVLDDCGQHADSSVVIPRYCRESRSVKQKSVAARQPCLVVTTSVPLFTCSNSQRWKLLRLPSKPGCNGGNCGPRGLSGDKAISPTAAVM